MRPLGPGADRPDDTGTQRHGHPTTRAPNDTGTPAPGRIAPGRIAPGRIAGVPRARPSVTAPGRIAPSQAERNGVERNGRSVGRSVTTTTDEVFGFLKLILHASRIPTSPSQNSNSGESWRQSCFSGVFLCSFVYTTCNSFPLTSCTYRHWMERDEEYLRTTIHSYAD